MFAKAIILVYLFVAVSRGAQDDDNLDRLLTDIFATPSSSTTTQAAVTENETTDPVSSEIKNVLDNKVDTIIERIFGQDGTTEAPDADKATPSDIDSIINQIFNPTEKNGTTQRPPSETSLDTRTDKCTTADGRAGVCVAYYLCSPVNQTIIIDGKLQVDIRKRRSIPGPLHPRYKRADYGECYSYIDICCLLEDDNGNKITEKPITKGKGCGWRNSDGVKNFTSNNDVGKTKFGEFPWMCAIIKIELVPDAKTGGQKIGDVYVGGGSLIHHSVVLTAAHYVISASRLRVRAGAWDAHDSSSAPFPYQLREITNIDLHDEFNRDNLFYDVALLYLSAPMVPAPNVGVVCLPPPRERIAAGTRCFATGWGKDKFGRQGQYQVVLKKVEVPVMGHTACEKLLRRTRLGQYFKLHFSFMCAGGEEDKDTCKGDGGSPLSCPIESDEGRYMQSGIVAWGIGCGKPGVPGVYVDVSSLRTWIDEKVKKRGYDPKTYTI